MFSSEIEGHERLDREQVPRKIIRTQEEKDPKLKWKKEAKRLLSYEQGVIHVIFITCEFHTAILKPSGS